METNTSMSSMGQESAVRERYTRSAREREESLCCPVVYDARYLAAIPQEVRERDYGCGDPSRFVGPGDTVLDLGSGGGKICFIASQIVGPEGRVIGVDANEEMLSLARQSAPAVAERVGHANTIFHRGRIQDLRLDLDRLETWLREHPVRSAGDLAALEDAADRLRREHPLIPDVSVDVVVSNCVLNLVPEEDKSQLIREIFRVLKPGGRIAISDIVSDEDVPEDLKADPDLWSACVSGAFQEGKLLRELERAGFYGIALDTWTEEPYRTVRGIEFRSVTVTARKGKEGPCFESNQAVIYRGPWKRVEDDDGHVLLRGERTAVCAKTFRLLTAEPYAGQIVPIEPRVPVLEAERAPFDCSRTTPRHPRETKGQAYTVTSEGSSSACGSNGCC